MLQEQPSGATAQQAQKEGATSVPPVAAGGTIIETGAQKAEDARLLAAERRAQMSPLQRHIEETRYDHLEFPGESHNGAAILAQRMESRRDYVPFTVAADCAVAIGILSTLGLPSLDDTLFISTLLEPGLPQKLAVSIDRTTIYGLIQRLDTERSYLVQLEQGMELLKKIFKEKREYEYERNLIEAMSRDGKLTLAINAEEALDVLLAKIREIVVARETQQPVTTT